VLKEKADSWHHGLSPSSRQGRLESILLALKNVADAGLGAASVLANLLHRRIVPLMERELRIYEMSETANPVSLACSQLLRDHSPGVHGHEGEARHQLQGRQAWQRRPLVVCYASRRPSGE
jgi:hypothetical protein